MSVLHINDDNYEAEIAGCDGIAMLDFWAGWCGPCKAIAPIIDEIADEVDGKYLVGKVDVDECPQLTAKFGVMSIPTIVVLSKGKELARTVGTQSKQKLLDMLTKAESEAQ